MILQIESFLREKENIFNKLYDLQIEFEEREQDVTELQRHSLYIRTVRPSLLFKGQLISE